MSKHLLLSETISALMMTLFALAIAVTGLQDTAISPEMVAAPLTASAHAN